MKIYDHWAKTGSRAVSPDGQNYWLVAWGGSNQDVNNAELAAKKAVASMQQRLSEKGALGDFYSYDHDRPLKEVVIQRVGDYENPRIAITRNRYGALVLNSARVFIADVDRTQSVYVPERATVADELLERFNASRHTPQKPPGLLQSLLGKLAPSGPAAIAKEMEKETARVEKLNAERDVLLNQYEQERGEQESLAMDRFEEFHAKYPSVAFRVYETAAGYRVIVTNQTMEPDHPTSIEWLDALGSDKLYRVLCARQHCYRARLTPKPWRLPDCTSKIFTPSVQAGDDSQLEPWLQRYEEQSKAYSVCRLLKSFGESTGSGNGMDEITEMLEIHDSYVFNTAGSEVLA